MNRISLLFYLACAAFFVLFFAQTAPAQNAFQLVRIIGAPDSEGGTLATDSKHGVYIADGRNNRVQKYDSSGTYLFSIGAGYNGVGGSIGSPGNGSGQFDSPGDVAVASNGDIFVADGYNNRIQRFDASGKYISQFGTSGNGNGQFNDPHGLALDANGAVFVVDAGNNRVQKFDNRGVYLLQFGSLGSGNGQFNLPQYLAVDGAGNVYVTDSENKRILKFDNQGSYLSQFGTAVYSYRGMFDFPDSIALDASGNIYVVDSQSNLVDVFNRNGSAIGEFTTNSLPYGVAVDNDGNVYVTDHFTHYISKYDKSNHLLLQFGTFANGQFLYPSGVATDSSGAFYVADTGNNRIQKFDQYGNYLLQFGSSGGGNGQFNSPNGMAADSAGNVYVADTYNGRVQKFDRSGAYLTQFGNTGVSSQSVNEPESVAVDASGNVYIADTIACRIIKFDSNGNYLLGVGAGYNGVSGGIGTVGYGNGQFEYPSGVTVDSGGAIYVVDNGNNRVQKFDAKGRFLLGIGAGYNGIPGTIGTHGSGNGQFDGPSSVAVDGNGVIYVADSLNYRIQLFDSGGNYLSQFALPSVGPGQPSDIASLALTGNGSLYLADTYNQRVLELAPVLPDSILTFDSIAANAPAQNVTFTFRPDDNSGDTVKTLAVPASGQYNLNGLPLKSGILHVKPDKYLAVNVPVDFSPGNITGIGATVQPGDANNDNSVDSSDFSILIGTYNSDIAIPGSGYESLADFNGDGFVDSTDFGLLIGNFNTAGAP